MVFEILTCLHKRYAYGLNSHIADPEVDLKTAMRDGIILRLFAQELLCELSKTTLEEQWYPVRKGPVACQEATTENEAVVGKECVAVLEKIKQIEVEKSDVGKAVDSQVNCQLVSV